MRLFVAVAIGFFFLESGLTMARSLGWTPQPSSRGILSFAAFADLAIGIWGLWVLVHS